LRAAVDGDDLAGRNDGSLDLRAGRHEIAGDASALRLSDVARAVLDSDRDAVPESEARLPHGARCVAAAHVDRLRSLADAHRQQHVTARAVESHDDTARRT